MLRRQFAEKATLLLGGIVSLALALPTLAYLLIPGRRKSSTGWTDAGSLSAIPKGKPTRLVLRRQKADAWKTKIEETTAWVLRREDDVIAFGPSCPHLGCGYTWSEDGERFVCPCHDSYFTRQGDTISGPSPRPLDRYRTRIEGGRLWLGEIVQAQELEEA